MSIYLKKTQITHVYVGQQHNGIEVFNAMASVAIKDDKVFYVGNSFVKDISGKINTVSPVISQKEAIQIVADNFKFENLQDLKLISSDNNIYI